jgi:hypothetical protein
MAGTLPGLKEVGFLVDVKNLAFFSGLLIGFVGYPLTILSRRAASSARSTCRAWSCMPPASRARCAWP